MYFFYIGLFQNIEPNLHATLNQKKLQFWSIFVCSKLYVNYFTKHLQKAYSLYSTLKNKLRCFF